jgi:integrase
VRRPKRTCGSIEEVATATGQTKFKAHWHIYVVNADGEQARAHRSKVLGIKKGANSNLESVSIADEHLPFLTKAEARLELARLIKEEAPAMVQRAVAVTQPIAPVPLVPTLGQFVDDTWLPSRRGTWRRNTELTVCRFLALIKNQWGATPLDKITEPACAAWLFESAVKRSGSFLHKLRLYLRSITAEAFDRGILPRDPLRRLKKPLAAKRTDRSYLTVDEIHRIRLEMKGRDLLILDLALATGMRPGELFALKLDDVQDNGLFIDEGYTRGRMEVPKTRASIAAVAVPAGLMTRLRVWIAEGKCRGPQDILFPSQAGTPIHSEHWRKRILAPAAKLAGVKCTFQVIRRTVATLSIAQGTSVKSVQAQLRHASAQTTMDVYAQIVTESQRAGAEQLFASMLA